MSAVRHETPEKSALRQEAAVADARKWSLLERLAKRLDVPLDRALASIGDDLAGKREGSS